MGSATCKQVHQLSTRGVINTADRKCDLNSPGLDHQKGVKHTNPDSILYPFIGWTEINESHGHQSNEATGQQMINQLSSNNHQQNMLNTLFKHQVPKFEKISFNNFSNLTVT